MSVSSLFADRREAGSTLAAALGELTGRQNLLVIGMPRGGIPVARVVADELRAPLDIIIARKLGVPGIPEVALGAIAEDSQRIVEESVSWFIGVPRQVIQQVALQERKELERRVALYRGNRAPPDVRGRTVVLVDDGAATGATLRAAAISLGASRPAQLIAAVPIASAAAVDSWRPHVHRIVTLATPDPFQTVSTRYDDFSPVSDAEVTASLGWPRGAHTTPDNGDVEQLVHIPVTGDSVEGDLGVPNDSPRSLILLAHGGGSSRASYRNRYLAGRLRLAGFATLRVDLLTQSEQAADASDAAVRFDVPRIADRLLSVAEWASRQGVAGAAHITIVGASTAAAAALVTAAVRPELVHAVVARGGRVDLAQDALHRVHVPVLLIVGSADRETLRWNRDAARHLSAPTRLAIVAGAGHTFEEPRALGAVGEHVVRWLTSPSKRSTRPLSRVLSGFAERVRFQT
ncbi:MAG: phosphoribosyltransferase family protein [Gemmatimonadaceae bacterium]